MNESQINRIVLLVEDSDDDAFFFERSFLTAAVPVRLVRVMHGGEAVEYLEKATAVSPDLSQTHLIFLDLKLPVLSGFEVLKWIKERGISAEVVVLSGSDIDSDMEMARVLGAADYLVKPISTEQLKKCLLKEEVTGSRT